MKTLLAPVTATATLLLSFPSSGQAFTAPHIEINKKQKVCNRNSGLGPVARNGLEYEDVEIGQGRRVLPGDAVLSYYVGTFSKKGTSNSNNNKPFSYLLPGGSSNPSWQVVTFDETKEGEPAEFVVGKGQVIKGFDLGICGSLELDIPPMKIGGNRKLKIPAALAYGAEEAPPLIPPDQDLNFQIAVLAAEQTGGISMELRLKGYAIVAVFAVTTLSLGWFVLHNI